MKRLSLLSIVLFLSTAARGEALAQTVTSTAELALPVISSEVLLYSDIWHGFRLVEGANALGVPLPSEKLEVLDSRAIVQGANTRVLLTLAAIDPAVKELPTAEWEQWIEDKIYFIRRGLGPHQFAFPPSVTLHDGERICLDFETTSLGTWAMFQTLAQGRNQKATEEALSTFVAHYQRVFGDTALTHAKVAEVTPFLVHPYTVRLNGRGHFDHQYPAVDYGLDNNPQMVDYLGRTDQVPYNSHDGDDFWMPFGSTVLAPVTGTTIWKDAQGVLIRPDNPAGYEIYIGHLSRVDVNLNSTVMQGETHLGLSGSANGVDHIHFEVRYYGKQTDTMGWYGVGPDPCPGLPAQGTYGGCEASSWLWSDEAPPLTPPANLILFSDTFSDGDLDGWTIVDASGAIEGPSDWSVVEAKGSLVLLQDSNIHTPSPPPYEGTHIYTGQSSWTDYHFKVNINPDDNDGVSVLFRYVDNGNFYRFIIDRQRNYRRLEKKVDGSYMTLDEDLTVGYGDDWHNVHIIVEGEEITVSLNYTPVFTVTDNSLSKGMIGLGTWGSTDCYFDNVSVATTGIDPYADAVADVYIRTGGNAHPDPAQALGGANGNVSAGYVSIGGPGYWLVLDMGEGEEIIDGPGGDLRIYEIGEVFGGIDEEYDLSVGNSPTGPWTYLGQGWTTSVFDLKGSGLASVRYVRIDDLSTRTISPPGSDIDAVQALNIADSVVIEAPSVVSMSIDGNDVVLSWNPVDRAIGYNVYASRLGGGVGFSSLDFVPATTIGSLVISLTTTAVNYTHHDAADDDLYYVITAIGPEGYESGFSLEVPYELFLPLVIRN